MHVLPAATLLFVLQAAATAGAAHSPAIDVVIHADDVSQQDLHGAWTVASDQTSADRIKLASWDAMATGSDPVARHGVGAVPLAEPDDFFDVTFFAAAGTPYHVWLRLRAPDNAAAADSVWVQFSDALVGGRPAYQLGTPSGLLVSLRSCSNCAPSGWGWQDSSWWFNQPATVTFAGSGMHTLRIQLRGQGVQVDQIVLGADRYLNGPPGPSQDDQTAVARTKG